MVASWRPDIYVGVAFNANPNDPNAIPAWTNLTSQFRTAKQVTEGRQYELDTTQANQPTLSFLDQGESLNPANTVGPYAPNVVPYRRILWQAQWPNTTSGNLLNAAYGENPDLGTVNGYDSSFESYALGSSVPWITPMGSTAPIVGNGAPHSGLQNLIYSVSNGGVPQGGSWVVPCIPGRQYTDSLYVRQSSASTQQIGVQGQSLVLDAFGRVVANGWGNADVGGAWSVAGVSSSEFSVNNGVAYQSLATTATVRSSFIGSNIFDVTVTARATVPVVAVGGAIQARVVVRRVDINNFYMLEAKFGVDSTVQVNLWKVVAGTSTSIASAFAPFGYTANTSVWLQLTATGPNLTGVCWLDGTTPASTGVTVTATDSSLATPAAVGVHSSLNSLNSNPLPVAIAWSNFSAVGVQYGSSTSATGSYQRLSVTYTATQPTCTIQLATSGTAVGGNVLLDDLQHEEGASASAFTTTGPAIFGVFSGYVERWPSRWDYMGFLGEADIACVDAFGPQNLITLWTEYRNAVLATAPAYYWPLSEAQGATAFAEVSGNNGPPLRTYNAGIGGTMAAGTSTAIAGDPSGTGVEVTGNNTGSSTDLEAGPAGQTITIGSNQANWAMSFSMWLNTTDLSASDFMMQTIAAPAGPGPAAVNLTGPATPTFSIQSHAGFTSVASPASYGDGKWHHYVGTILQSGGLLTITLYVDGAQVATNTVNVLATFGGVVPDFRMGWAQLFGMSRNGSLFPYSPLTNGTYAHFALWTRALSAGEVSTLWTAGKGFPGETSGTRVARYLSYAWVGPSVVDAGQSIMGVSNLSAGTSLLQANQDVTTTENGNYWVDQDGNTTFAARTRRYLETTSTVTFGEHETNGEYPYLGDIAFDVDPTLVFNKVEVDNYQGVTAISTDKASQRAYFQRAYQRQVNVKDDNEAIDASTYLLNQHAQPHLRVQQITLDPASNPNLWPVILSLRIGQRVTVRRRASAANGGAGLTIQADFFVEQKSLDSFDVRGIWTYKLYLSPIDINQVGILDSSTYGLLGSGGAVLAAGISAGATTAIVASTSGADVFTTSGTFPATIDSEILTVTAVGPVATDTFGRTVSPGWGTATSGQTWTPMNNPNDFAVSGGVGIIAPGAVADDRIITMPVTNDHQDITLQLQSQPNPTGGVSKRGLVTNYIDGNNHYVAWAEVATTGAVSLVIAKRVSGSLTQLANVTTSVSLASNAFLRFQVSGSTLRAKLWPTSGTEPGAWMATAVDGVLTPASNAGVFSRRDGSTPASFSYGTFVVNNPQVFTITRPTDGTAVAHSTGAPVQTFQPFILAY